MKTQKLGRIRRFQAALFHVVATRRLSAGTKRVLNIILRQVVCDANLEPVLYIDVRKTLQRLARRKSLAHKLVKRSVWTMDLLENAVSRRRANRSWNQYLMSNAIKDLSYAYEDEVRLTVRLSKISKMNRERNLDNLASVANGERDFEKRAGRQYLKHFLDKAPANIKNSSHFPVSISPSFIESVFVDPRAPSYKQQFISSYFQNLGIRVNKSVSLDVAHQDLYSLPYEVF